MFTPATVIIGNHTQGLGILRSAAAAGGKVWVVNDKSVSLTRFSKYLTGYKRIPRGTLGNLGHDDADEALLEALLELPVEYPSLLCGVDEDIVAFIDRFRRRLAHKYAIPEVRLDTIVDKYLFNALLPESLRIWTRLCSEVDIRQEREPQRYILKGRQGTAFRRITNRKAVPLARLTREKRRRLFSQLRPQDVVIQEIVGTDRPVASLCSFSISGRMSAVFAYEKLRQHPQDFGTGTFLRSITPDVLRPLAAEIVSRTGFTGISEIEFVFDRRTNTYKAVEMNPRTWKSVHFATLCGQNLVARYLMYLANGREITNVEYARYAPNRYWTDLATDIPELIRERRLPRYPRGTFECTWSRSDPMPAVVLWTLLPLIGAEEQLAALAAEIRTRRTDTGTSVRSWIA
jgi:predicted ATP-grasp superfamily ATP-dependent carboligase